jgi:hypothetical protein
VSSGDRIRRQLEQPPSQLGAALQQLEGAELNVLEVGAAATAQDAGVSATVAVGTDRAGAAAAGGVTRKSGWWAAARGWLRWGKA